MARRTAGLHVLERGGARAAVRPEAGGRVASLSVEGWELLAPVAASPYTWGCYPMAPFAGRVRRGRFSYGGRERRLPLTMPPHAIHGTAVLRAWDAVGPGRLSTGLGPDWPFGGRAEASYSLREGGLDAVLELFAERPMPASIGWHPCLRRRLRLPDGRESAPAEVGLAAEAMLARDREGIATARRVPPGPGPWDDAFVGVAEPVTVTWPGALRLELRADAPCWVVYTEAEGFVCAEPQTGPPDALNLCPATVEPGSPLRLRLRMDWAML